MNVVFEAMKMNNCKQTVKIVSLDGSLLFLTKSLETSRSFVCLTAIETSTFTVVYAELLVWTLNVGTHSRMLRTWRRCSRQWLRRGKRWMPRGYWHLKETKQETLCVYSFIPCHLTPNPTLQLCKLRACRPIHGDYSRRNEPSGFWTAVLACVFPYSMSDSKTKNCRRF